MNICLKGRQEQTMEKIVLLAGSGGFVGKAVLCCTAHEALLVKPLARNKAAMQILAARSEYPSAQISLLNLAWPSLQQYSASLGEQSGKDQDWQSYKGWLSTVIEAAVQSNVRFFQIGSGIEPYALAEAPVIGEPYLGYARRKDEIWRQVGAALPVASWRLRLHFLFGSGEAAHRFIPSAIRAYQTGETLTIGATARRRCWLHVDDAARGLLTAASMAKPENWDICGAMPVSFAELLTLIGEVTGGAADIEAPGRDVADASCLVVAPTRLAPFMPDGVGELDNLRKRLKNYAQSLAD